MASFLLATMPSGVALGEENPKVDLAQKPVEQLSFHQALERALLKSPDYDTLMRTSHNSHLLSKNAWATIFPEIDLQAYHQYADQGGSLPPTAVIYPHAPWSNFAGVTVNENLYDNGESYRQVEISNLSASIADLAANRGRQALLLKVAKAYYDFSSAMGSIVLQRQEIETLRQQFRTIEGRYRQGMSSNRDFLRIKVQLQRAEISLQTQEISIEESGTALRLAIGESRDVGFVPLSEDANSLDGMRFPDVMPEETFDYRIARMQDEVSDLKFGSAVRADLPRLTLKGSYSYDVPEYLGPRVPGQDDPYWNFTGLIVLDYTLFDWGIRHHNIEIADNQKQIEMDVQKTIRLSAAQALNRLKKQVQLYLNSYRESRSILKNEEEAYESLNRGYREGKVTYLDLITALDDLYSSRTQNIGLQYALLKARADVAFYQGNLDEVLQNQ